MNELEKIGRKNSDSMEHAMRNDSIFDWRFAGKTLALGAFLNIILGVWLRGSILIILAHYNPHGLPLGRGWRLGDWVVDAVLETPFGCGLGAYMAARCIHAKYNIGALRYAAYFLGPSFFVIMLATLYSVAVGNWELSVDAPFVMLLWGVILVEIMIRKRPRE